MRRWLRRWLGLRCALGFCPAERRTDTLIYIAECRECGKVLYLGP